jgi:hypothetical protein
MLVDTTQDLVNLGHAGLATWMPGVITEQERKQAELLDSDSDAEYDEDVNQVRWRLVGHLQLVG